MLTLTLTESILVKLVKLNGIRFSILIFHDNLIAVIGNIDAIQFSIPEKSILSNQLPLKILSLKLCLGKGI